MPIKLSNNASSRLASAVSNTDTTVSVRSGDGVMFPILAEGDWFPLTLVRADGVREICRCTERVGDNLTISRGHEGTAASAFGVGDRIELRMTAEAFTSLVDDETSGKIDITSPLLRWLGVPIGMPFPILDHIPGMPVPPTDNELFRFIKLTANDNYNAGALTGEVVSGSAPKLSATATISHTGSPIDGQIVRLINTERRFVAAGASGLVEADQVLSHTHSNSVSTAAAHSHSGTTSQAGEHSHYYNVRNPGSPNVNGGSPNVTRPDFGQAETSAEGRHSHTFSTNSAGGHIHTVTINSTGGTENLVRNLRASFYMRIS